MAAPKIKVPTRTRMLNGQVVQIVLYDGKHVGHGKYYAGSIGGELILDESDVPVRYKHIGSLEWDI